VWRQHRQCQAQQRKRSPSGAAATSTELHETASVLRPMRAPGASLISGCWNDLQVVRGGCRWEGLSRVRREVRSRGCWFRRGVIHVGDRQLPVWHRVAPLVTGSAFLSVPRVGLAATRLH